MNTVNLFRWDGKILFLYSFIFFSLIYSFVYLFFCKTKIQNKLQDCWRSDMVAVAARSTMVATFWSNSQWYDQKIKSKWSQALASIPTIGVSIGCKKFVEKDCTGEGKLTVGGGVGQHAVEIDKWKWRRLRLLLLLSSGFVAERWRFC